MLFKKTLPPFLVTAFSFLLAAPLFAQHQPVEGLLQTYCLGCHNQQNAEGGLSLQTFDALKQGADSGDVWDKTNPKDSVLYEVLLENSDNPMPPVDEPQPSKQERERLLQWVLSGQPIQAMASGIPDVPDIPAAERTKPRLLSSAVLSDSEVAFGGSRVIVVKNIRSSKTLRQFEIEDGDVTSLTAVAEGSRLLASIGLPGIDGYAALMSSTDGKVLQKYQGHTDAVYSAAMSPDETIVATAGYDRRILLHDAASGEVLRTLTGHNGSIFQLAFDREGNTISSASTDGTVKVWNVKTGERLDTLSQPQGEQYAVQVGRLTNRIYAAGQDNRIRVWKLVSVQKPKINPLLVSMFAHEQTIHRMKLSDDEKFLATAAEDGTVRVWTTSPLQQRQSLPRQTSMVTALSFLNDSRLLVTRLDGTSQAFEITSSSKGEQSVAKTMPEAKPTTVMAATEPAAPMAVKESETPNDDAATAQPVSVPATISGAINPVAGHTDADFYGFDALQGQQLVVEVNAARKKSKLDSRIEILTEAGEPILRTQLQAVRDSYFTFRGKNSSQFNDFRLFNWREMELNEYLYADGEVTKLYHYPRGPDSGFNVYPGFGSRHTYFGTTATSHALQAPAFVVVPRDPNEELTANGLPVFPVYYENDDDGLRELGADSRLFFDVPMDGRYVVKITDARDFGGADYSYDLTIREAKPSFTAKHNASKLTVAKGTGSEIEFKIRRMDQFDGPVMIEAEGIPEGFICSTPVTVQAGQYRAWATMFATDDAVAPTAEQVQAIQFVAIGQKADGSEQRIKLDGPKELILKDAPKLKIAIVDSRTSADARKVAFEEIATRPVTLSIRPGQTIKADLKLDRVSHKGVVSFGKEEAGRNLPHGVFVDNIGLNGLLLLQDQSDREFFITAAPTAQPGTYSFHLKSNVDNATSYPAILIVEP